MKRLLKNLVGWINAETKPAARASSKQVFRPGLESLEDRRILAPLSIGIGSVGLMGLINNPGQSNYVPLDPKTEAQINESRMMANRTLGTTLMQDNYGGAFQQVGLGSSNAAALISVAGLGGPGIPTSLLNQVTSTSSPPGSVPFPTTQGGGYNSADFMSAYLGLPGSNPRLVAKVLGPSTSSYSPWSGPVTPFPTYQGGGSALQSYMEDVARFVKQYPSPGSSALQFSWGVPRKVSFTTFA